MSDIAKLRSVRDEFKKNFDYKVSRWAVEDEGEAMYWLVKDKKIAQVIEIGTANGWTASWFALAGVDVWTFDIADRPKVYLDPKFPLPDLKSRIRFSNIKSPDCVQSFPFRPEGKVLYFIDALHTQAATMEDFKAVQKVAKVGDYVLLHDTKTEVGTARAWAEIKAMGLGETQEYATRNGMGLLKLEK